MHHRSTCSDRMHVHVCIGARMDASAARGSHTMKEGPLPGQPVLCCVCCQESHPHAASLATQLSALSDAGGWCMRMILLFCGAAGAGVVLDEGNGMIVVQQPLLTQRVVPGDCIMPPGSKMYTVRCVVLISVLSRSSLCLGAPFKIQQQLVYSLFIHLTSPITCHYGHHVHRACGQR